VSFAQTPAGKATILLLFGLGLKYSVPEWKVMTLWLALITVLPKGNSFKGRQKYAKRAPKARKVRRRRLRTHHGPQRGRGGRGRPQAGQGRLIRRNTIDSASTGLYISCKRNGEFMASLTTDKNGTIVVSALKARTNFGKLLRRVEDERRSLVIEKRGTPKAVLLSIRDYVKLAAPEPQVLKILGEESERKGTSKLTARQIDQAIKAARAAKPKR
jgi:prevent-host-death family protein